MLGTVLRDFYCEIAGVDHRLLHPVNFVAEHERILAICGFRRGTFSRRQFNRVLRLLDGDDGVAVGAEGSDSVEGIGVVLPRHHLLGPERGLVNFGRRRKGADAAEGYAVDMEGVGAAENAADVIGAAHIVQHHRYARRRRSCRGPR